MSASRTFNVYCNIIGRSAFTALLMVLTLGVCGTVPLPAQAQLVSNGALEFDGKNDVVTVPAQGVAQLGSQVTVQAWVKPRVLDTGTWVAVWQGTDYDKPVKGSTQTHKYSMSLMSDKWSPLDWVLSVCLPDCIDVSTVSLTPGGQLAPNEWQHIAAVFDGVAGTVTLYLAGQDGYEWHDTYSDPLLTGDTLGFFYSIVGRMVGTFDGVIDDVRLWNRTLSLEEIRSGLSCPLAGNEEGLVGLWRFDEAGPAQTVVDSAGAGMWMEGYLGDNAEARGDRYDPLRVAGYDFDPTDTDGDGVADACDNCPTVFSTSQEDRDGDGFGTACDYCPQLAGTDGDGDDWADRCGTEILAQTDSSVSGSIMTTTTTWTGGPAYWIPPDCDNTLILCCRDNCLDADGRLIEENILPRNCIRQAPYQISVEEDEFTPGFGMPSGDLVPVGQPATVNVVTNECDLLELYSHAILAQANECTALYMNWTEDRDLDYETGECPPETVCVDPNDTGGPVFIGASNADPAPVAIRAVTLDVKPGSDPSSFNINSGGVVPVAINGTASFDPDPVTTVNTATLLVGVDGNSGDGCLPIKDTYKDWNGDGNMDLVIHYDTSCLRDTAGVTVNTTALFISGATYGDPAAGIDPVPLFGADLTVHVND
jgi:hypothetical protein